MALGGGLLYIIWVIVAIIIIIILLQFLFHLLFILPSITAGVDEEILIHAYNNIGTTFS